MLLMPSPNAAVLLDLAIAALPALRFAKVKLFHVAMGKQLYAANCASCHGVDATGQLGPNLRGVVQRLGEQGVFGVVRNGRGGMPPVSSINCSIILIARSWSPGFDRRFSASASNWRTSGDAATSGGASSASAITLSQSERSRYLRSSFK